MKRIVLLPVVFAVLFGLIQHCAGCEILFGYMKLYVPGTSQYATEKVSITINCTTATAHIGLMPKDSAIVPRGQIPGESLYETRTVYYNRYMPESKSYQREKVKITLNRKTAAITMELVSKSTPIAFAGYPVPRY